MYIASTTNPKSQQRKNKKTDNASNAASGLKKVNPRTPFMQKRKWTRSKVSGIESYKRRRGHSCIARFVTQAHWLRKYHGCNLCRIMQATSFLPTRWSAWTALARLTLALMQPWIRDSCVIIVKSVALSSYIETLAVSRESGHIKSWSVRHFVREWNFLCSCLVMHLNPLLRNFVLNLNSWSCPLSIIACHIYR